MKHSQCMAKLRVACYGHDGRNTGVITDRYGDTFWIVRHDKDGGTYFYMPEQMRILKPRKAEYAWVSHPHVLKFDPSTLTSQNYTYPVMNADGTMRAITITVHNREWKKYKLVK